MINREDVDRDGVLTSWWQKDGYWHHTVPYAPTEEDRRFFPVSYPTGNDGPFRNWDGTGYDTESEARIAGLASR